MADMVDINALPDDLLESILIRLPAKTLGRAAVVSKRWRQKICNDGFVLRHARARSVKPSFLICPDMSEPVGGAAFYVPMEKEVLATANAAGYERVFLDPGGKSFVTILATCSALVLFDRRFNMFYECTDSAENWKLSEPVDGRLCVCNPTTKSCVPVPYPGFYSLAGYGLAFDVAVSATTFKLVVQERYPTSSTSFKAVSKVFSSEDRRWRLFERPNPPPVEVSGRSVYCAGKLHWPSCSGANVVVFDTETDEDSVIDSAMATTPTWYRSHCLGVADGRLSMVALSMEGSVRVWHLADYGGDGSWTLERQIAAPEAPRNIAVWYDGEKCVLIKDTDDGVEFVKWDVHRSTESTSTSPWEELFPRHRRGPRSWTYLPYSSTMLRIKY